SELRIRHKLRELRITSGRRSIEPVLQLERNDQLVHKRRTESRHLLIWSNRQRFVAIIVESRSQDAHLLSARHGPNTDHGIRCRWTTRHSATTRELLYRDFNRDRAYVVTGGRIDATVGGD